MRTENPERWGLAGLVLDRWWAPLSEEDGIPEEELIAAERRLGLRLPEALREWYRFAGRRHDCIGNYEHLEAPEDLDIKDGILIVCFENQAVVRWGIRVPDRGLVDPPVVVDEVMMTDPVSGDWIDIRGWTTISSSTSEFITGMVVIATLLKGHFNAMGPARPALLDAIRQRYELLHPTNGFFHHFRGVDSTGAPLTGQLFGDADTLIGWDGRETGNEHWGLGVAARTIAALQRFRDLAGADWGNIFHNGPRWEHNIEPNCYDVPPPYIVDQGSPDRFLTDWEVPACHVMD